MLIQKIAILRNRKHHKQSINILNLSWFFKRLLTSFTTLTSIDSSNDSITYPYICFRVLKLLWNLKWHCTVCNSSAWIFICFSFTNRRKSFQFMSSDEHMKFSFITHFNDTKTNSLLSLLIWLFASPLDSCFHHLIYAFILHSLVFYTSSRQKIFIRNV